MYNKIMKRKIIILLIALFQILPFNNFFGVSAEFRPFPSAYIAYDTKIKSHYNLGFYNFGVPFLSVINKLPLLHFVFIEGFRVCGLSMRKTFGGDIDRYTILLNMISTQTGLCFQENKNGYDTGIAVHTSRGFFGFQMVYVSQKIHLSFGVGI